MIKEHKLLEEAYNTILKEDEQHDKKFLEVLSTFKPGMIYSFKGKQSPYNHYKFMSGPNNTDAGFQRLYGQGVHVMTDMSGQVRGKLEDIEQLEPSEMSAEEYDKQRKEFESGLTSAISSYNVD